MIKSFACKETEKIWIGMIVRKFSSELQKIARRKLRMINNSLDITDLRVPPGNRLEELKGDRQGTYSIRINDQWRITFKWIYGDSFDLKIEDYH